MISDDELFNENVDTMRGLASDLGHRIEPVLREWLFEQDLDDPESRANVMLAAQIVQANAMAIIMFTLYGWTSQSDEFMAAAGRSYVDLLDRAMGVLENASGPKH